MNKRQDILPHLVEKIAEADPNCGIVFEIPVLVVACGTTLALLVFGCYSVVSGRAPVWLVNASAGSI
ncbi:hypothetical protein ACFL1X_07015 [Candidatus Hydrogenedentota bacterium]